MKLTNLEYYILFKMEHGRSIKQIAFLRDCSIRTIQQHIRNARLRNNMIDLPLYSFVCYFSKWRMLENFNEKTN